MHGHRRSTVLVLTAVAAISVAPALADELLHGLPAWDSGWRYVPVGQATTLTHGVGGDLADYVVDLQFRDVYSVVSNLGIHQLGLGQDRESGTAVGGYWSALDTSVIKVVHPTGDSHVGQMRVRLWVVPGADYDSGWTAITPGGTDLTLTHGLGGDPDDYVVDLWLFNTTGSVIHALGLGGDRYWDADHVADTGAYWYGLTGSQVKVHRGADDTAANQVRVRIWRRPAPDYDSGWKTGSVQYQLTHDLGGPWNDLVVDLQLRDADDGLGVSQAGCGGDRYMDGARAEHVEGAYWTELSGRSIRFRRMADDPAADQFRVRLWSSRRPKYDSGWTPMGQGALLPLTHELGGDPDTYVVDLQFTDTWDDGNGGYGANAIFLGGNQRQETARATVYYGAYWWYLSNSSVLVLRGSDDLRADQVRVRIWIAAAPDYDSGWTTLAASGSPQTFTHLVGGYTTDDYVVDLGLDDPDFNGLSCAQLGGDTYQVGGSAAYHGAYWWDLDTASVKVTRQVDDAVADMARVRIWRNPAFDVDSDWLTVNPAQERTLAHGLGSPGGSVVVDLQMDSDETSVGVNGRSLGGDTFFDAGDVYNEVGANWRSLDGDGLAVWRGTQDAHADRVRVRLWRTDVRGPIFADAFESGDLGAWSAMAR